MTNLGKEGVVVQDFKIYTRHFRLRMRKHLYSGGERVFPFDYMSSWGRFDDQELPTITAFYNKLSEYGISESDFHC